MERIATILGLDECDEDGRELTEKELEERVASKALDLKMDCESFRAKADASRLLSDDALADCTVRVTIGTAVGDPKGKGTKRPAPKEIKAHAAILALQSRYFESAFSKEWRERADKSVDISLDSDQAYEDFGLLIKLSYTPSYTSLDGTPLDNHTLTRLLVLSDSFEFVQCATECADKLVDMDHDDALRCFQLIPDSVAGHAAFERVLDHAGDSLASELPVMTELWEPGIIWAKDDPRPELTEALPLKKSVQDLPLGALKRVLKSDKLVVTSENETFWLIRSWVDHQVIDKNLEEENAQAYFQELFDCLRLKEFSLHYLANVVLTYDRVRDMKLADHLSRALWCRSGVGKALRKHIELPPSRVLPGHNGRWTYKASFPLAEIQSLEPGQVLVQVGPGLVGGYPFELMLREEEEDGRPSTVSVLLSLKICVSSKRQLENEIAIQTELLVANIRRRGSLKGPVVSWRLFRDAAREPWADVMKEGSRFIDERNNFNVEVTVWFPDDD